MKTFLTALIFFIALNAFGQVQKINNELYLFSNPPAENNCTGEIKFNPLIHENVPAGYSGSNAEFIWPFSNGLDDGLVLVNYVDDRSGSIITDYMGNSWSYNGHAGTDIALNSFWDMDRFVYVKAAESGTVIEISYNNFDRNTAMDGSPANYVLIRHADGSYAYYYHLMKKSVTVKVGEYVQQGSIIGYVGSSGSSTDAHLHFEPGYFYNGQWNNRDPWHGTYNTFPTMWQSQYAYVGDRGFKFQDMGIYTSSLVGGDITQPQNYLKEKIIQPVTVSGYEAKIGLWVQLQGINTNKQVRYEIRKPNGTLFASTYYYLNSDTRYSWSWWYPDFNVGVSETGNWYARVLFDNVEQSRDYFNVQLLTSNRPRFYPVAGKCFRPSILVQKDTLRVRPVRSNMQYELVSAPSNVTLVNDSILTIGAFTQSYRTVQFKVIGSIGGSSTLRDTMIYKLIDSSKNNFGGNGVASLDLKVMPEGRWNGTSLAGDTVTAIIRAPLSPYLIADSARVKLNSSGYAIANFFNLSDGVYYYIVVKHRNSIETWSKTVQQFNTGFPISYDFTTSRTKAYGDNMKYKSGKYCIYSGDINQDAFIDITDYSIVDNAVSIFGGGYTISDLDGDLFVDVSDMAIVDNNAYNFVSRIRP
jgi:murein DD-endopeptidase MepM/ murein hydrolase activator NlpD